MADNVNTSGLNTRILLLNGTRTEWNDVVEAASAEGRSIVLKKGEPAVEFIPNIGTTSTELETVKLKIGDGFTKYEDLPYVGDEILVEIASLRDEFSTTVENVGNAVFQIDAADLTDVEGSTEADKIVAYLTTQNVDVKFKTGNIAIVKKAIVDGNFSYTAYVYTDGKFAAMDGNYNAENVYFNDDMTFTANIGALTLASGKSSGTYQTKGLSLESVLKGLLAKTIASSVTNPSFSMSSNGVTTDTGNFEIGSKIKEIKWNGTFNSGSYSYGSKDVSTGTVYTKNNGTGISATFKITNDIDDQEKTTEDGTFTLAEDDYIQIDSTSEETYANIVGIASWNASTRSPVNNIGEIDKDPIVAGSDETSVAIKATGYRDTFYYVGTDCTTTIDSEFIRTNGISKGANTVDIGTLEIPKGTKRVLVAIPGSHTLTEVIDVDGMGLKIQGDFETKTVPVKGANNFEATNYSVFVFENTNGAEATHFAFTIS